MVSALGSRLTEAHRLAQARLGVQTALAVATSFPLLDPHHIDDTFHPWLNVVTPIISSHRTQSSHLAASYLTTLRSIELGAGVAPFAPLIAGDAPDEQVATSMLVTGPVALSSRLGRMTEAVAVSMTTAGAAAAAMRLALGGGRATIVDTVRADRRARGWERVTSGAACDFCSMLADRGAVYSEDTADFEAHDHCSCSAEPIYE